MSKLNCPLLKSKAATKSKGQTQVATLLGIAFGLTFGLGVSLSMESSVIASLAHKETELVAIHAIADAIQAEKTDVAVSENTKTASLAAL
jgi:hypothetical protein